MITVISNKWTMKRVLLASQFLGVFCLWIEIQAASKIKFGVIQDSDGYYEKIIGIIQVVIDYVTARMDDDMLYSVERIDPDRPLRQQMEGDCGNSSATEVLFSATMCKTLRSLAAQSSELNLLHFAVNVDYCELLDSPVLLDTVPQSDVAKAIVDVLQERNSRVDVIILHDVDYEGEGSVQSLLRELSFRRISYSYLLLDTNVTRLSRRIDVVRSGAKELSAVVLADFADFKTLIDKAYEHNLLDAGVTYVIVNDGWESVNPEIDEPQPVNYTIDLHMLMLKRKLKSEFSDMLVDMAEADGDRPDMFHHWKVAYLEREDLFLSAAVWSVANALYVQSSVNGQCFQDKSGGFQEQPFKNPRLFATHVTRTMQEIGVLSDSLAYDLLRNIPVDSRREIFRPIAQWRVNAEPKFQYLKTDIERELLFENRTLKLAMPFTPPYTFPVGNDTNDADDGALEKLFTYLSRHLKFKYETLRPEDNEWGVLMSNKTWSGAIQMLLGRSVDLIPFLGITQGRSRVLEFSEPVMTTSSGILVQKPREPPRARIFLRPFASEVWYMIIASVPAMTMILYCVNNRGARYTRVKRLKRRRGLFKLQNCFWYVYGAILQQGGVYLPDAISARIVVSTWWIFVVVTIATYTGNLTAFLTFPEADWKVSSIQELAKKESLTVFVLEGTSIHQEISDTDVEMLRLLNDRITERRNALLVSNLSSVLPLVQAGKAAFIDDFYVLADVINTAHNETGVCNLAIVPKTFSEIYLAIATRKGSPYMKDIDNLIRRLWHGGLMQHWADRYSQLSQECNFIPTMLRGGRKDVTLRDLTGAFLLLLAGLVISLVSGLVECLWNVYGRWNVRKKDAYFRRRKLRAFPVEKIYPSNSLGVFSIPPKSKNWFLIHINSLGRTM